MKKLLSCLAVLSLLLTTAPFTQVKAAESASTMVEPRWTTKTQTFTKSVSVGGIKCNVSIQARASLLGGQMRIEYVTGSAKASNSAVTAIVKNPINGSEAYFDVYCKYNNDERIVSFYLTSADFN